MKKNVLIMIVSLMVTNLSFGQDVIQSEEKKSLVVSGFADVYYQYALKKTATPTSFTEQPNSFTLGMASVKLEKTVKNVGLVADLGWGPRAENANGSIGTSLASYQAIVFDLFAERKIEIYVWKFLHFCWL